jgi:hypothetical protein
MFRAQVRTSADQGRGYRMATPRARLDAARKAYREALEVARANPTPEAWARLLAAGKELSSAEDPRAHGRRGRRRPATPPATDPEGSPERGEGPLERGEGLE